MLLCRVKNFNPSNTKREHVERLMELANMSTAWPSKALGFDEAPSVRRYETRDIARRLGVVSPDRLFINGFPARNPIALFNPAMLLEREDDENTIVLFPRIIVGYYKYVSAIVEARIPLSDILSGSVSINYYSSTIVIQPSSRYDLWGAEDPRAYTIAGKRLITYTGRTISYFEPGGGDRTLPVTAVEAGEGWRKIIVHRPTTGLSRRVISNKNAYMLEHEGEIYFFHRPTLSDGSNILLASRLPNETVKKLIREPPEEEEPREVYAERDCQIMPPASFEKKLGWTAPPIHLGGNDYLFLLHGVGRRMEVYRVFAAIIELDPSEGPRIKAVTPTYIMEPRESYETFGDRPYTVFPCGLVRIDDSLLIAYGAADYMVAFALIPLDELLHELDKGRLE